MTALRQSSDLKPRLLALIATFDEGGGPVAAEARRRRQPDVVIDEHLSVFADRAYPADLRAFLDQEGLGRLYQDDIAKAFSLLDSPDTASVAPTGKRGVSRQGRRRVGRPRGRGAWVLVALAVASLAALAFWAMTAFASWPTAQRLAPTTARPPTSAPSSPASEASSPEASACRTQAEISAAAWCVRALVGPEGSTTPLDQGDLQAFAESGDRCADPMETRARTIVVALDRLFDEGRAFHYSPAEAHDRCRAAARIGAASHR